jgi:hypothetical protein
MNSKLRKLEKEADKLNMTRYDGFNRKQIVGLINKFDASDFDKEYKYETENRKSIILKLWTFKFVCRVEIGKMKVNNEWFIIVLMYYQDYKIKDENIDENLEKL